LWDKTPDRTSQVTYAKRGTEDAAVAFYDAVGANEKAITPFI
jgi:hypothetical protein